MVKYITLTPVEDPNQPMINTEFIIFPGAIIGLVRKANTTTGVMCAGVNFHVQEPIEEILGKLEAIEMM